MAGKKKFFEIELPIIKQKAELYSDSEENLIGRAVKIDLTRKLRGKSLEITFKIKRVEGKAKAEAYRLYLLGYFIRRMMRKSINYVEDSFSSECKDAVLKIKPFFITRKKVSRKIRKVLRDGAREFIGELIKDRTYEEIFSELLQGSFQKTLSLKLKKIYPLSLCEIRDIFILRERQDIKVEEEKIK
ncbi:MAG: hypothetical protein AABX71_02905 [Nanoarchaeota archaeon]